MFFCSSIFNSTQLELYPKTEVFIIIFIILLCNYSSLTTRSNIIGFVSEH
jgi:hypothetical protein